MNIIISHKFLLFAVAISLAISVPLTEAAKKQFIRGTVEKKNEREPRKLKKSKHGRPISGFPNSSGQPATTTAVPNNFVSTPPGTTVAGWESKCSVTSRSLDVCVGGDIKRKNTCKQCLLGQATLSTPYSSNNVLSCTKIPKPSGLCGMNCQDKVMDFFNCGAGTSLTKTPSTNVLVPTSGSFTPGALSKTIVTGSP
jgi:hypothetical protein